MHIEQVTIKNFRCFEHLEVNLNPDVNVFVGNNGSGKSALLDAIAAAVYPFFSTFKSLAIGHISERGQPRISSPIDSSDLRIIEGDEEHQSIFLSISTSHFPRIETEYQPFLFQLGNLHMVPTFHKNNREVLDDSASGIIQALVENSDEPFPLLAYYKGHRELAKANKVSNTQNGIIDRIASLNGSLDAGANFTDLAQWFFIREIQELREAKKKGDITLELDDLRIVRQAVSSIVEPSSRIYFSQEESQAELKVEWIDREGVTKNLSLNQLSSGYRNMLALVMDFARRLTQANPGMKDPLEAEAVLLIDEIDLHLHPSWQQRVIPDLRKVFPNTQIIVTTHSPEVVTTVEQHQVFLLDDYQIKDCPSPTRGMRSSEVVRYVLGLDDLRPETEEKQTLIRLFEAIDDGDIDSARRFREELKSWESFDSDLTRADMQIRRMERRASA